MLFLYCNAFNFNSTEGHFTPRKSRTPLEKILFFQDISIKIRKNPFVLKKIRMLFRTSEMPLEFNCMKVLKPANNNKTECSLREETYAGRNSRRLEKREILLINFQESAKVGNFNRNKLSHIRFVIKFCSVSNVPRLFNSSSESSIPRLDSSIV